jgi:hypothetical protein
MRRNLLTPEQLAQYLGLAPKTLANGRPRGFDTPPFKKIGTSAKAPVRYDPDEVDAWLEHGSPPLVEWRAIWKRLKPSRLAG